MATQSFHQGSINGNASIVEFPIICVQKKNLTTSLDAHLLGDNHKKKVDAVKEAEGKRKALSSGRVGRPSWQASVVNALNKGEDGKIQQHIGPFSHLDRAVLVLVTHLKVLSMLPLYARVYGKNLYMLMVVKPM